VEVWFLKLAFARRIDLDISTMGRPHRRPATARLSILY